MNKQVVALVPVKGNSERVKKKNLRPFADTTLFDLKIQQLVKVGMFSDIIVSSECADVLNRARQYGVNVHERDPYYSTSEVPMSEVYTHIASNFNFEHIAWVNVTNPLADCDVYAEALTIYSDLGPQYDCLLSVRKLQEYIYHEQKPLNFKPNPWQRSQDLAGTHSLTFVINVLRRSDMVMWGSCVGKRPYLYELDSLTSTDIDQQHNFDFCELVYRNK